MSIFWKKITKTNVINNLTFYPMAYSEYLETKKGINSSSFS